MRLFQVSVMSLSMLLASSLAALAADNCSQKTINKAPQVKIDTTKKTVKKPKRSRARAYTYGAYFVPPPPAYMPSILPELQVSQLNTRVSNPDDQEQSSYKRYVYNHDGRSDIRPLELRNGVAVWSKAGATPTLKTW